MRQLSLLGLAILSLSTLAYMGMRWNRPGGDAAAIPSPIADPRAVNSRRAESYTAESPTYGRQAVTQQLRESASSSSSAELEDCRRTVASLEKTRHALEDEITELSTQLRLAKNPETTPYGAFLRSSEGAAVRDVNVLRGIEAWLKLYPVFLASGEGSWLADRIRNNDWKTFAPTQEQAVIEFLGPARIAAVISPEELSKLREEYAGVISFPP